MMGFRMVFASIGLLISGLIATPGNIANGGPAIWLVIGLLMALPVAICVIATGKATQEAWQP